VKQTLWLPECNHCGRPKAPRGHVPVKDSEAKDYCARSCLGYEEWPHPSELREWHAAKKPDADDERPSLHQARLGPWAPEELKVQLAAIVDRLKDKRSVSPLDVMLELLSGELDAFVLFARMGHLDPPREDGKIPIGILQRRSEDPEIDARIRDTAKTWAAKQESRS